MRMNIPTIVIGLGGVGSEIVAKVEMQLQQHDSARKGQEYKRDNVRFVIIDTDINSIRERENSGYRGASVRISSNISVSNCLEMDKEAKEEWFPHNKIYYRKSIAEGAGQVRAISRLALQRAIRAGMLEPLYKTISDLFMHASNLNEQEMKIIIVSTVAGGTGSGSLLPLGMHIKEYLKRVYSNAGAKMNAFLILPDILYDVIPSNKEKRNLNANSYAVVKEIDALFNESDMEVKIKLPNESGDEVLEIAESPFDFCFLFNKLSRENDIYGNIEDYKDVIARCLHTQFLGNMAHDYFSREDNVLSSSIREVDGKQYCERFAGVGCSIVRYPFAEIKEYLSLCWMLDIMKKEWMKYDEKRREIQEINLEKQERGEDVTLYTDREAFLLAVEDLDSQEKEWKNTLPGCKEKLRLRCQQTGKSGLIQELCNHIHARIGLARKDVESRIRDAYDIIDSGQIKKVKEQRQKMADYISLKTELEEENERIYINLGGVLEREICRLHVGEIRPYYLEYYIQNEEKEYETPNYIRFCLYQFAEELDRKRESLEKEIEALKMSHDSQLRLEIDVSELKKHAIKNQMKERYGLYMGMLELLELELEHYCITELSKYIKKLSANYERFFREYDRMLLLAEQRKIEMEKRFGETVHRMEHWVYSKNEHLQSMLSQMKARTDYYTVAGQISEWIYMEAIKQESSGFGQRIVDQYENVKKMWEKQFDKNYADRFDFNVLRALKEETKCSHTGIVDCKKVKDRLEDARQKASILVSSCRVPDVQTRKYCIYPAEILNDTDCDEVKKTFFMNGNAFADSNQLDVDDKQIVFFEIAYGFLPSDIDFFAKKSGDCAEYPMGSGIESYEWIMEKFYTGDDTKEVKITPHIDKTWN